MPLRECLHSSGRARYSPLSFCPLPLFVPQAPGPKKEHRRRPIENADPALFSAQPSYQRSLVYTNARSDIRGADDPLPFQQLLNAFDDVIRLGALRFVQGVQEFCSSGAEIVCEPRLEIL